MVASEHVLIESTRKNSCNQVFMQYIKAVSPDLMGVDPGVHVECGAKLRWHVVHAFSNDLQSQRLIGRKFHHI